MSSEQAVLAVFTERIREAAVAGTPLRIRGGGSKDFYGQTLQGEILDTTTLAGIVSYEPSELVVTVRAGTPLLELEALLAAAGQCLPFEPPHFVGRAGAFAAMGGQKPAGISTVASTRATTESMANVGVAVPTGVATVGGMVAAALSGPARASAGAVRDYVLGLKLINGRGELLTFGGQVMKNVAGYDASRLMAGAMGTLGLMTEISLKVMPLATAEATLQFEGSQAQALEWLNAWGGQPLPLNASCWMNDAGTGLLRLRLRGAQAAVDAACISLGGQRLHADMANAWWQACREQQLPWFAARNAGQDLWRLSVPQTTPVLDLPMATLVEWHGGQRWLHATRDQAAAVRAAASAAGGHATVFIAYEAHGQGSAACFDALKPPLNRIQRALKREFDPAGIFNRGRMYADF